MKESIDSKLTQLTLRLEELDHLLSSENATANMDNYRKLTREHAEITPVVELYRTYRGAEGDLQAAVEMANDPAMREFAHSRVDLTASLRYEGALPHEEAVRAYTRIQLAAFAEGRSLPLSILQDGVIVGSIGARIDLQRDSAELGYWIDEAAEGRGPVTRAGDAVVDHLAAERGVRRFEIRTAVHNTRSRAVAERAGFVLEGVLRGAFRVGDERHDVAVYGLVRP